MRAREATRQRSWSHLHRQVSILLAVVAALVCADARAQVLLAPSADGHFGAFLAAGPIPSREALDVGELHPVEGARMSQRLGWLKWTVADGGKGAFDLGHVFGATANRGVLAAELVLPSALAGWLLVSADGALTVSIDGKPVFQRETPHLRGGGWDPVPLSLAPGVHTLVFDLVRSGRPWLAEFRLLAGSDLEPPLDSRLRLPAVTAATAERLTSRLVDARLLSGVVPGGFQPQIRVEFPRGAPVEPQIAISALLSSHGSPIAGAYTLGTVRGRRGVEPLGVLLPALSTEATSGEKTPDKATVRVGAEELSLPTRFDTAVATAVTRGLALRRALSARTFPHLSDVATVVATLESHLSLLAALESNGDPGAVARAKLLIAFIDRIEAGADPLRDRGVLELARRSRIDGQPDALSLHVPVSYSADSSRKYPLVVVLHGLGGNAERVMAAFLGTDSLSPHPKVDGFVLAPYAHGDAFYRGPGETEVMDAIDWAVHEYPIDEQRISVTGISMGGTGAAHFAFRFPDRFAAAAALAGYHSYFVRRDVLGRVLRPWEVTELTRWSPASFAENGRDIPLLVAQGTSDLPLSHSRSLADRYRALGYPLRETWPDIGHDVWRIVWGNAELWPSLSARRAPAQPKHVTIKTDSLRLASRAWARITAFAPGSPAAVLDATLAADRVVVRTSGVAAFELRPREAGLVGPASLEVDGVTLELPARDPLSVHRTSGGWSTGPLPNSGAREKRPSVEGPIRDAFNGPLAFVYGTLDDRQTNAAREVAEHFKNRWAGDTRFPVLADRAAPKGLGVTHSLFLIGGRDSNLLVRELDASLPFGIDGGVVRAGRQRLTGDGELGAAFVYPNPKNPDRYVVVVEAVSAAGLFRAESLPSQLPDFIVFDSGLARAAGQQVLGDARVLGAGYFDRNWVLPARFGDVLSPDFPRKVGP